MQAWISSHRYAIRVAIRSLALEPWSWLSAALVIATAVLLPWLLFSVIQLAGPNLKYLATDPEVSVFMKIEANADDIVRARSVIEQQTKSSGTAAGKVQVTWVSKAQALEQLKAQTARAGGHSSALAVLQENPLPDAFIIRLPGWAPEQVNKLAESLRRGLAQVDLVQVDTAWMQTLGRLIATLNLILWWAAAIFCLVVMAVTFNATRSQALQLRDEIELARLVGATDAFIRRPFFYRGALLGALGGVLALLLALLLLSTLAYAFQSMSQDLSALLSHHVWAGERWLESAVVIMMSCLLGAVGGGWAAQRQLYASRKSEQ